MEATHPQQDDTTDTWQKAEKWEKEGHEAESVGGSVRQIRDSIPENDQPHLPQACMLSQHAHRINSLAPSYSGSKMPLGCSHSVACNRFPSERIKMASIG